MLDLGEIFTTMQGTMLEGGYDTVEERDFFEWRNAEYERVCAATDMSEEERDNRLYELGELKKLSMPYRNKSDLPYVMERYVARLKSGKNYYSQRPLHWDSSTVK